MPGYACMVNTPGGYIDHDGVRPYQLHLTQKFWRLTQVAGTQTTKVPVHKEKGQQSPFLVPEMETA